LNDVNYSAATLAILDTLSRDPDTSLYTREVAERSHISVGAASMLLRVLEGSHMISVEEKGGMKFYRINLFNPVAREFKVLFNVQRISRLVEPLKDHCDRIILFGSLADGTDGPESDVDLLVLTSEPQVAKDLLRVFQKRIDRHLSPIIVGAEGLARLRREDKALFEQVYRGKTLWEKQ
jgi:predicted nucleotidyltransferase